MKKSSEHDTGTVSLILETVGQAARIIRLEASLAGEELSENLKAVGLSLGILTCGASLAIVALGMLAHAAVSAIVSFGLSSAWAAFLVGIFALVLAGFLIVLGFRGLDPKRLKPRRAVENLRRDIAILQERIDGKA